MQLVSSRSRSTVSLLSRSPSLKIHRPAVGAALIRPYSQNHSHHESQSNFFWYVALIATSAAAGVSFPGASSFSSQTLCDNTSSVTLENQTNPDQSMEGEPQTEQEVDPYDNLPDKDEPTHCSICLTYRQGPCRPYWRKVEACTKDGEKEKKEKEKEGASGELDGKNKDNDKNDGSSSPMDDTHCFKYMMPWIDCASRHRNLYTLIEMDTNYTEGIKELEATSSHFCWVPGQEPKIDWSNWQQSNAEDVNEEAAGVTKKINSDSTSGNSSNVALWKTIDPAHGDPKFITIEAQVPTTNDSGLGILECAYAQDEDNNVIGFAYGTKPSDLISHDKKKEDGDNNIKDTEAKDNEKNENGADSNKTDEKEKEENMVTLNIRLLPSRTQSFILSASYTHRIEKAKSTDGGGEKNIALESHLYKSKPFTLANIPKLANPASVTYETSNEKLSKPTSS